MRRLSGKKGAAALFDSLLFLSVVATVSIVLLASFSLTDEMPAGRSNVEDVHAVLLRCTIAMGHGKNATMLEAIASSDQLTPEMERLASTTLSDLMPLASWQWSYRSTRLSFSLGSNIPDGCDVYASTIIVSDGVLTLQTWRA